jgi:hypothetical protein
MSGYMSGTMSMANLGSLNVAKTRLQNVLSPGFTQMLSDLQFLERKSGHLNILNGKLQGLQELMPTLGNGFEGE